MRSFQQRLADFDQRGIRVVAISVDSPEINTRKMKYNLPLLSDVDAKVIRRYDLLHSGGGPHKEDISRPGEFLVDTTGTIRWRNLTENIGVRAHPAEVLAAFDRTVAAGD